MKREQGAAFVFQKHFDTRFQNTRFLLIRTQCVIEPISKLTNSLQKVDDEVNVDPTSSWPLIASGQTALLRYRRGLGNAKMQK